MGIFLGWRPEVLLLHSLSRNHVLRLLSGKPSEGETPHQSGQGPGKSLPALNSSLVLSRSASLPVLTTLVQRRLFLFALQTTR